MLIFFYFSIINIHNVKYFLSKSLILIYLKSCEISSENCSTQLCNNAGKCLLDTKTDMGFRCVCDPNYTGSTCSQNINPCSSNPCKEDYTCINSPNGEFMCICIQGVTCPVSFRNYLLSKSPDNQTKLTNSPCLINTCQNDGMCEIIDNENFACICKFGYIGNSGALIFLMIENYFFYRSK